MQNRHQTGKDDNLDPKKNSNINNNNNNNNNNNHPNYNSLNAQNSNLSFNIFDVLPLDILNEVISFLPASALIRMKQVNKKFNYLCKQSLFAKKIENYKPILITQKNLVKYFDFNQYGAAIHTFDAGMVRVIVKNGICDVNATNNDLQTPLHLAIDVYNRCKIDYKNKGFLNNKDKKKLLKNKEKLREIIRILIENGADLEAKDRKGLTPLALAKSKELKSVVKLIKEFQSKNNNNNKHNSEKMPRR